jgi:hypothetical protein
VITLNSEKGLIHIESWEEIEARPGFVKDLDPTEHKLDAIIGRYIFKDETRCGLSNCHTPHVKGYIVVTKDGYETNIGKDCGRTYFGVDFETLSRRFDREITQAENRERLWSFSFQLDEVERKLTELRSADKGADWVYRNLRPLITPSAGCPEAIVRRISAMIKSRSNVLAIEREATEAEVEMREASENRKLPRPVYVNEPIAKIAGLEALYPENDLRTLLVLELEIKLKEFQGLSIDELDHEDLRYWVKWADAVEPTLERATQVVTYGRRLLDVANLQPLLRTLTLQADTNAFRAYLRGLR